MEKEKYPDNVAFTVTMFHDYGFGCESWKPLAVGVDKATANSIRRHYYKNGTCFENYANDECVYVSVISRNYCTNHKDFEKESAVY